MTTTPLEKAVDNYVDSLTAQELRQFVFNNLLETLSDWDTNFIKEWGDK